MKFVAEAATKYSGRLGTLLQPETGQTFSTPLLMQTTKSGSIPNLSKEVFGLLTNNVEIHQISLSTTDHMDEALNHFQNGIAEYVGFKESPVFVSLKDPNEIAPSGFNEKDIVPMFTRRGKQAITAERYMKLLENMKPNIFHTLCDADTNIDSPKKRIQKSIDRSEQFQDECLEIYKDSKILSKALLIAPIVGGFCKFSRSLSIKSVLKHSEFGGYSIEGLHNYGESAMTINLDSLKDIVMHDIVKLPVDKLKIMSGAYNPLTLLELIRLGIDVFDSSYVYIASQNSRILTFQFDDCEIDGNKEQDATYCINLNDDKYKDDFTPFLKGCSCLACQKHTKAYAHHLVQTNEMLAPILFMIHNTHHYMKFFERIRECIKNDQLPELIDALKNQMTDEINGKTSVVDIKPLKSDVKHKKRKLSNVDEIKCSA